MTPKDFIAWRVRMATRRGKPYSQADAARDLDLSPRMVKMYEKGQHPSRTDAAGKPVAVKIPTSVALACAALETGLKPL